jgi:hypothetical protein
MNMTLNRQDAKVAKKTFYLETKNLASWRFDSFFAGDSKGKI